MNGELTCRVCHGKDITLLDLPINSFITSDCNKWHGSKPQFYMCACKYVGKAVNDSYKDSLGHTYKNYEPYWQNRKPGEPKAAVSEQRSLDITSGKFLSRSDLLVNYLFNKSNLLELNYMPCTILEYGCGSAPFLDALENSEIRNYVVDLADLNDINCEVISKKSRFRKFYNITNQILDQTYDLITLVHVLEHVDNPVVLLNNLSESLKDNGKLLVQIPNSSINPFDFIIADHLSHFSLANIIKLIQKTDLKVFDYSVETVPKEITLLLGKNHNEIKLPNFDDKLALPMDFFYDYENLINKLTSEHEIIIFGTSIGALWLTSEIQRRGLKISAYLDEDEGRVGNNINYVEIKHPRDFNLPKSGVVLIPLAPILVTEIFRKYPKFKESMNLD